MTEPGRESDQGTQVVPTTLRWAVRLLLAQACVVAVVTAVLVYDDIVAPATERGAAVFITGYAAAMGLLYAMCGFVLRRRGTWVRGLAVVLELMLLPIGYYMVRGGVPWFGIPVLMVGLTGVALLVAPATQRALTRH